MLVETTQVEPQLEHEATEAAEAVDDPPVDGCGPWPRAASSRRSAKYVLPDGADGALGCSVQADRRVRSPRG